jgi:hypothetical protein
MISDPIPVFLNGRPCRVVPGSTLGQLLAQDDPDLARALALGTANATDGRGIAVDEGTPLVAGAIFRVVRSARAAGPANA